MKMKKLLLITVFCPSLVFGSGILEASKYLLDTDTPYVVIPRVSAMEDKRLDVFVVPDKYISPTEAKRAINNLLKELDCMTSLQASGMTSLSYSSLKYSPGVLQVKIDAIQDKLYSLTRRR